MNGDNFSLILFWKSHVPEFITDYFSEKEKKNIISNCEEFDKLTKDYSKLNDSNGIVILCELDWDGKGNKVNLQALSGIEIAKQLRLDGVNVPILFTSFLSRPQILRHKPENEILKAIGHTFIRLPVLLETFEEELKKINKLSKIELRDVQLFSCKPDGIVNEKIHVIDSIPLDNDTKERLMNYIQDIHNIFGMNYAEFLENFERKFSRITIENIDDAKLFVKTKGVKLINEYRNRDEKVKLQLHSSYKEKDWCLLMLDDDVSLHEKIKKILEKEVEVLSTTNAAEARSFIECDDRYRGKISALLIDYRLNKSDDKDGVEVQQSEQGYTFLQDVGKRFQSKILGAIVYSGMPRLFVMETARSYKINPEIISKIDINQNDENALNHLKSKILELGDDNYNAMLALPCSNSGWTEYFDRYYKEYRRKPNYELEIRDYCTNWVEEFKAKEKPKTPMIRGDAFKPRQNEREEESMERFIAYYKTRRLALYLQVYFRHLKKENISEEIADILMPEHKKRTTANIKGFFSQILALKLEEFPFGATIEELCWFDYDLGIQILEDYTSYRNKLIKSEEKLGHFISNIKLLTDHIERNNFECKILINELEFEYKRQSKKLNKDFAILKFNKNYIPYLFDKSDFGLCTKFIKVFMNNTTETFDAGTTKEYSILLEEIRTIWKTI